MKQRVYNFSPGPAILPEEVLLQAQEEMLNWNNCGMSVMEVSHRGAEFKHIAAQTIDSLKKLLPIPQHYHVLFLQGGARTQFSMVPMNLLGNKKKCQYIITGNWSKTAAKDAEVFAEVAKFDAIKNQESMEVIDPAQWLIDDAAAYCHMTNNETVDGIEIMETPQTGHIPLVADMSSNLLSRKINVEDYDIIYACAQKNLGPAGVTFVIVNENCLQEVIENTPSMLNYKNHIEKESLFNTPPTYSLYISGLVFDWMLKQGGLDELEKRNLKKSQLLYDLIDQSDFYQNNVPAKYRSRMNVPFLLRDNSLDPIFLEQAKAAGLLNLKGHRSVGGMRASIYNAMPEEGVVKLATFMADFQKQHQQ